MSELEAATEMDTQTVDAIRAIEAFGAAMERSIEQGVYDLIAGRPTVEVAWGKLLNGDATLRIELADGTLIEGRGGGKLDALVEAGRALG